MTQQTHDVVFVQNASEECYWSVILMCSYKNWTQLPSDNNNWAALLLFSSIISSETLLQKMDKSLTFHRGQSFFHQQNRGVNRLRRIVENPLLRSKIRPAMFQIFLTEKIDANQWIVFAKTSEQVKKLILNSKY